MSFCSQLRQLHDLYEVVNLHHSQNRVQGTVGAQVAVRRSLQHVRSSYLRKNDGSASTENMLPEQQSRACRRPSTWASCQCTVTCVRTTYSSKMKTSCKNILFHQPRSKLTRSSGTSFHRYCIYNYNALSFNINN